MTFARDAAALHRTAMALVLGLLAATAAIADTDSPPEPGEKDGFSDLSLAEIDQRLNNPLTSIWSLTLQNNTTLSDGDRIDGSAAGNSFFFQPALPVPVGDDLIFIARPVFPLVTSPVLDPSADDGVDGHVTGFGDIQMLSLVGPSRIHGVVWGVGPTLIFPTASKDELGQGKYQAGPGGMAFYLGEQWNVGLLAQHWWSFAGDSDRASTSRTDLQYILRRRLPDAWSVGLGPTITVDWQADSGDRLTLPIGLGVTKTVRIGKAPVKLRAEVHYSVIQPDSLGTEWNFRIQVTPVIPNPFI